MRTACILAFATAAIAAAEARAQVVIAYSPAVVAPAPVVAYRPVTPVVAYAPIVAAPPMAVTRAYTATPVVTTRYRPILGGTVSRVRYRYHPTTIVTPLY